MLKAACRRFHRHVERSILDPHESTCAACARYARTIRMVRRARVRSELPPRLALRLRRIATPRPTLAHPLPGVDVPAELQARLRSIPTLAAAPPPPSLRSPVPGVAASTLLVVALSLALGNPYLAGAEAARRIAGRTAGAWSELESHGVRLLSSLSEASTQVREEASATGQGLLVATERLLERTRQLPQLLITEEAARDAGPSNAEPTPIEQEE